MKKTKNSELFLSFLKVGLFTFGGGFAMIPIIEREVISKNKWVEKSDFADLLTLAQSAPGALALNSAVFVGYKVNGYKGAFISILGIVIPSFVIILAIALFFSSFRENHYVEACFKGIRPAVVALILAPVAGLSRGVSYKKLSVAFMIAFIIWYFSISLVYIVLGGFTYGIIRAYFNFRRA